MAENSGYLFEMLGVTKQFPGVKALDNVTLQVKKGSVHALCGENGAGKSTLMKVLAGIYKQNSGKILIEGKEVEILNPKDAMDKGISMIHQELNLFPQMTVEANLYIGRENSYSGGIINKQQNFKEVNAILKEYGIDIDPHLRMSELTIAKQQMIEIVRAIAFNAKIIIMDEPTSSLTDVEIRTLFRMIRKLVSEGKSVIYISHRMDEIFEIADMVTVIRDGQTIDTLPVEALDKMKIIKMMVGRDLKNIYNKKQIQLGAERLRVEKLSSGKQFQEISFSVHSGEIVGLMGLVGAGRSELAETIFGLRKLESGRIYVSEKPVHISFSVHSGEIVGLMGLVGAGRSELAETIFGLRKLESGRIYVSEKPVHIKKPWNAINAKIAFITEDRKRFGISRIHSVRQNIVIANLKKYAENILQVVSSKKEKEATDRMIDILNIKTPTQKFKVGNLSGGNQQKVVIGKWLLTEPDILIMDEPTRGIDVGAKSEIYGIMSEMAEQGKSILMISSEMQELMGMCDRIVVMCAGKQTGIFDRSEFNQFKLMACAAGESKAEVDKYEN